MSEYNATMDGLVIRTLKLQLFVWRRTCYVSWFVISVLIGFTVFFAMATPC